MSGLAQYQLWLGGCCSIGYPLLDRIVTCARRGLMRSLPTMQRLGVDGRARPPEHGLRRVLPQRNGITTLPISHFRAFHNR